MSKFVPNNRNDMDTGVVSLQHSSEEKTSKPRGKKPFHRGVRGKASVQKRSDAHREKVSQAFVQKLDEERAARIPARFVPLPELTSVEAVSKNASQVPISTRGIGAAVAKSYSAASSQYGDKVARICSPMTAFRCSLLQATYCIQRAEETRPASTLQMESHESVFLDSSISSIVSSNTKTLNLVSVVIAGIGCFDESKGSFWTSVPTTDQFSIDRLYCYTAVNLRALVMAAASASHADFRSAFADCCTIPGAQFSDTSRLTNPNDICPNGWPNRASVLADFEAFNSLMTFLEGKMPFLLGSVSYDGKALPFSLVTRTRGPDIVPGRVTMHGSVYVFDIPHDITYFSKYCIEDGHLIRGVLSLLGERDSSTIRRCEALVSSTIDWNYYASKAVQR